MAAQIFAKCLSDVGVWLGSWIGPSITKWGLLMRRLCATYAPLVPDCLGSSLGLPPPLGWWRWTVPFKGSYGGARNCYNHLCAERHPVMSDSLRISSYSRKLCCMQIAQGRPIKKVTALSKIDLCELYAKNNKFYNGLFWLLMRRRCGA